MWNEMDKTPEPPVYRRSILPARRSVLTPVASAQKENTPCTASKAPKGSNTFRTTDKSNTATVSKPLFQFRRRFNKETHAELLQILSEIELDQDDETMKVNENKANVRSVKAPKTDPEISPPKLETEDFRKPEVPRSPSTAPSIKSFAPGSHVLTINNKKYMIFNLLGSGGSSKVFSGMGDGEVVAIKDVTLPEDPSIEENYRTEIDKLQKLSDCDQVVKLIDFEIRSQERKLYVVMEKGDSDLATILQRYTVKDWLTLRFYFRDMLRAVDRIHKMGIIHQDLKPANFILVKGALKLIDFGISDEIGDATSCYRQQAMGTINYMSPELLKQYSEDAIKTSRASDIWSLGCILYSMAFGTPPFGRYKNMSAKILAIINPENEIFYPEDADPDLVDILRLCLQRDPKQRPTTAQLLCHRFLQGAPSYKR